MLLLVDANILISALISRGLKQDLLLDCAIWSDEKALEIMKKYGWIGRDY